MQEEMEVSLTDKVLALFETRKEINASMIVELLPNENPTSVRSAIARLRGKDDKPRRLRAKAYVNIVGRPGIEVPVLELGEMPDVTRTIDNIQVDDEHIRRASAMRAKREDIKFQRQMADLDRW